MTPRGLQPSVSIREGKMSITTRKGDSGRTDLFFGPRVRKDHPRIRALGALDELNSWLGLVKVRHPKPALRRMVHECQEDLIVLCSEVAALPRNRGRLKRRIDAEAVARIEAHTTGLAARVKATGVFIVPGANELSACIDIARCVARRAEREVIACEGPAGAGRIGVYLNRLSDLLYLLARAADK